MLFLSKLCIVTYTAFRYPDGCGKDKLKVHVVCWRETRASRRGIFHPLERPKPRRSTRSCGKRTRAGEWWFLSAS